MVHLSSNSLDKGDMYVVETTSPQRMPFEESKFNFLLNLKVLILSLNNEQPLHSGHWGWCQCVFIKNKSMKFRELVVLSLYVVHIQTACVDGVWSDLFTAALLKGCLFITRLVGTDVLMDCTGYNSKQSINEEPWVML